MDLNALVQKLNDFPDDALERESGLDAVREVIVPLCVSFQSASSNVRKTATSNLHRSAQQLLLTYARTSAVAAVRRKSRELVDSGLLALAVEGGRLDPRDSTIAMAVLFNSGRRLDMDLQRAFADTAQLIPESTFREVMRGFPFREAKSRDLSAFLMREKMTPDGFVYEQIEPRLPISKRVLRLLRSGI